MQRRSRLTWVVLPAALAFLAAPFDAHASNSERTPGSSEAIGLAMRPTMGADPAVLRWVGDERIDPARATPRPNLFRVAIAGSLSAAALLLLIAGRLPADVVRPRPIRQRLAATRWLRGPPVLLLAFR